MTRARSAIRDRDGLAREDGLVSIQRDRFLEHVQRNPISCALLEPAAQLDVPDWWLASGAVFQTVWKVIDGRDPTAGIGDYDLIYFDDTDLSWDAEARASQRAESLRRSLLAAFSGELVA